MGKETYRLRTRVYVAGPITVGDVAANVQQAITAGLDLLNRGYAPFIPHLGHFAEPAATWDKNPKRYEEWLELDRSFIVTCDAILRLPGFSKGADREVKWAYEIGVPVFYSLSSLLDQVTPTQSYEVAHS